MSVSAQSNGSGGVGTIINDQYRISKKLGGGSFGDIYLGIGQQGEKVAIKFEKHTTRCPQLRHEYKVYRELQNCEGFGRVYYFGTHNSGFNVMVMDLLGGSLEDLFTKCGRRFSLKTVLQVADQLLERIETMHNRHLIHRDVKPANFVLGPGRGCQTVFSIDFGLSTRYRHPRTLQHIPYREGRSLTGTPRYASINNHLGVEQSRRDDLESIGYVLIYFLKGSLPWQGLKARNAKRKYKMILERKQAISIQQLCHALPQQFAEYLAYCRSLKFEAKPNISYLRGLFRELYKGQGFGPGPNGLLEWDWTKFEAAEAADGADIDGANTPHMLASSGLGRAGGGGTEAVSSPFNAAGTQRATAGTPARSSALGYGSGDLMLDGIAGGGGTPHAVPRLAHTPEAQSAAAPPPQHSLLGGMRMPSAAAAAAQQEADIGWGAGAAAAAAAAAHSGYSTYPQAAAAAVPRASGVAGDSPRRDAAAAAGKDNARSSPAAQSSSGGWGMWNLRAKSSGGGFWGGGVRGWSGRDAGGGGSGAQSHGHEAAAGGGGGGAATPPLAGAAGLAGGAKATTRPHTAHGGRVEVLGSPAAVAAPGHVVASARGVMRYREEQGRSSGAAAAAAAAAAAGTLPMHSAWAGSPGAAAGAAAAAAAAAGGYKVMGVSAARPSSSGGWDRQPSASTGSGAYGGGGGVAAGRPSTSAGVTAGSARNPYVHGGIGAGGGGGAVVTASSLLSGGGGGSGKLQQRPVSAARSRGQGVVVPSRKKFMRPPTAFAAGVNY